MSEKIQLLTEELLQLLESPERTVDTLPQTAGDRALVEVVENRLEKIVEGVRNVRSSPDKLLLTSSGHGGQFVPA